MGVHMNVYVITGYKTTRQELDSEILDRILEEEPNGIVALQDETEGVVIGRIGNKIDEYGTQGPQLVRRHFLAMLASDISDLGIPVCASQIGHYIWGVWQ